MLRETGAQHFPRTGSFERDAHTQCSERRKPMSSEAIAAIDTYCEPMAAAALQDSMMARQARALRGIVRTAQRTEVAASALASPSRGRIEVLPFFDLTAGLHAMHLERKQCDCTHFCYYPPLWAAHFSSIARSVEAHKRIHISQ